MIIIIITPWVGDIVNFTMIFYLSVCYFRLFVCFSWREGCVVVVVWVFICFIIVAVVFFMFCGVYIFFKGGSWASHHEVLLLFDKLFSCSLEIISYELTIQTSLPVKTTEWNTRKKSWQRVLYWQELELSI